MLLAARSAWTRQRLLSAAATQDGSDSAAVVLSEVACSVQSVIAQVCDCGHGLYVPAR